jgi:hypothetical protein
MNIDDKIEDHDMPDGKTGSKDPLTNTKNLSTDKLRGRLFIGKIQTYDDPKDEAYGLSIERKCDYCFFRLYDGNMSDDCTMRHNVAKRYFGFKQSEFMPKTIDGKEVAHYCKYFTDYRAE